MLEEGELALAELDEPDVEGRFAFLPGHEPPPGWMVVRHASGRPCYVHLPTKMCTWAPPYIVDEVHPLERHAPPQVVQAALEQVLARPITRTTPSDVAVLSSFTSATTVEETTDCSGSGGSRSGEAKRPRRPQSATEASWDAPAQPPPPPPPPPPPLVASLSSPPFSAATLTARAAGTVGTGHATSAANANQLGGSGGSGATDAAAAAAAAAAAGTGSTSSGGAPNPLEVPRRPEALPSRKLPGVTANGHNRMHHGGCPQFTVDITGKSAASVLNEYAITVLKCPVEYVVTTQEDPVNPYLTAIVCDGIVIARGAYGNKKMSRQVASRKALSILAPLLDLSSADVSVSSNTVDTGGGVVGGVGATMEHLEAREVETLRLPLSDDRILDNPIGKTPVMVLQEHCHKYVGKAPDYVDTVEVPGSLPVYRVTATLFSGERASALDTIKKKAKQRCALELLRRLYPHVELWGDLVESTNSRLREDRARKIRERRAPPPGADLPPPQPSRDAHAQGQPGSLPSSGVVVGAPGTRPSAASGVGAPSLTAGDDDVRPTIPFDKVTRQQLESTKTRIWERIATLNNGAAGRQIISISTQPAKSASASAQRRRASESETHKPDADRIPERDPAEAPSCSL